MKHHNENQVIHAIKHHINARMEIYWKVWYLHLPLGDGEERTWKIRQRKIDWEIFEVFVAGKSHFGGANLVAHRLLDQTARRVNCTWRDRLLDRRASSQGFKLDKRIFKLLTTNKQRATNLRRSN